MSEDHFVTAIYNHNGTCMIGCRCGLLLVAEPTDKPWKAWERHAEEVREDEVLYFLRCQEKVAIGAEEYQCQGRDGHEGKHRCDEMTWGGE